MHNRYESVKILRWQHQRNIFNIREQNKYNTIFKNAVNDMVNSIGFNQKPT